MPRAKKIFSRATVGTRAKPKLDNTEDNKRIMHVTKLCYILFLWNNINRQD
jgi:hypothetical protein